MNIRMIIRSDYHVEPIEMKQHMIVPRTNAISRSGKQSFWTSLIKREKNMNTHKHHQTSIVT